MRTMDELLALRLSIEHWNVNAGADSVADAAVEAARAEEMFLRALWPAGAEIEPAP